MKIVSVHVPKTAGLSFQKHLAHLFGKRAIWDYNHTDRPDYRPEPPQPHLLAQLRTNKTTVIHGHFFLSRYHNIPGIQRAMWFRDPVERLLSHYYYWLKAKDDDHPNCRRLHEEGLSVLEFAKINELRNIYARFLDGELISELNWVGLVEDYQDSLDLFYAMYAVDRNPRELQAHENKNLIRKAEKYEIDPMLRVELETLNAVDYDIYRGVKDMFQELKDRYGKGY